MIMGAGSSTSSPRSSDIEPIKVTALRRGRSAPNGMRRQRSHEKLLETFRYTSGKKQSAGELISMSAIEVLQSSSTDEHLDDKTSSASRLNSPRFQSQVTREASHSIDFLTHSNRVYRIQVENYKMRDDDAWKETENVHIGSVGPSTDVTRRGAMASSFADRIMQFMDRRPLL